jgi:hypothetical protein
MRYFAVGINLTDVRFAGPKSKAVKRELRQMWRFPDFRIRIMLSVYYTCKHGPPKVAEVECDGHTKENTRERASNHHRTEQGTGISSPPEPAND